MRRFDRAQSIRFLRAIDMCLNGDVDVFIVGGMAALLGYHATVKTADIDVYDIERGTAADLMQAAQAARELTKMSITIGSGSVADLPVNYIDRTKPVRGVKLNRLTVKVPDKYDLVLSKTVRGWPHDLDAIRSIHKQHRLSETTLVKRFEIESWHNAVTDPRKYAFNMVLVIRMLFGAKRAKVYQAKWLDPKPDA